ncbi:GSCFA domain-containing protein [Winogradskyella sp. SYSU M77433]|uniref:GSCFA domain-containing protein n=1 Tax=Winogradskyella sp. SYSU M77433 TaxID=3042722 RepID=UPI00247FFB60|nr:GSCFA domain-containing protein [Winogradskyella sp. SYSU M77433]MDH7913254.1 GSCFA domain-containing protein [Winogradskyella sp. SYSU M77433]
MKLQTNIPLQPQQHNQIDYNAKVMLLGSCFSENIGGKFDYFKFQSNVNPFGVLFHTVAIENLVARSINEDFYSEEELIYNNEVYSCFDAHSKLNSSTQKDVLRTLNDSIKSTHQQLKDATHIIVTLGTAWVYRYIASDKIVANCHKVPQKQFLKELLPIDDILASIENTIALIRSVNPKANFIFTVSPVRHLKDGFVENTQSKSHLLSAIHQVVDPRHQQYYFPSYEIMMDELRDYRFYNSDMIHPSDLAVDYIWEKFKTVWLSEDAQQVLDNVKQIQSGLAHKPFNPDSEAHQKFQMKLNERIEVLQTEYPHMNFNK